MPQIISTTVYTYDELPNDAAKSKARDWFNEGHYDNFWAECVIEHLQAEKLPALGFDNTVISYSGFSSQGDGASFTCFIDFLKYCEAFNMALRPMIRRLVESGEVQVCAKIVRTSHHYSHENTVCSDWDIEINRDKYPLIFEALDTICEGIQDNARQTMREIYRELEKAYDWEVGEENTAENIRANGYTFTETGKRFG